MRNGELSSAAALAHTFRLIRENGPGAAAAVVLLTAVGTAADQLPALVLPLTLVSAGLSIAFQDRLTSSALRLAGQEGNPGSRFGGVFLVSLLGNLGIVLGLLFFIVPGIYLFARWSLAIPVLIEEDRGPGEALRTSWERTAGHLGPILVTFLPIYLPMLGGFAWRSHSASRSFRIRRSACSSTSASRPASSSAGTPRWRYTSPSLPKAGSPRSSAEAGAAAGT